MYLLKNAASVLTFTFMNISVIFAQASQNETIEDKELQQFASAFQQIQLISHETQQTMIQAVEEEGLGVQRYNAIQDAQQDPDKQVNATSEELNQFETVNQELEKIQIQAQQKMQESIIDEGLSLDRYQELAELIRNDPELQLKLQQLLQG